MSWLGYFHRSHKVNELHDNKEQSVRAQRFLFFCDALFAYNRGVFNSWLSG